MITKKELDSIERFADKLWAKVGLDVEFTRHFLDRINDARNKKDITSAEIQRLFKQSYRRYGKKIASLGQGAQAVIKDMETDINMPFVLQLDRNGELDLVAKTVMRKKDFKTTNQKFTIEEGGAGDYGTKELSYKYRKDTPNQSINGKTMKREKFIPKQVIDEDVPAFMGALAQAAKDGKKEFEFGGKTFKVKLKKDVVDKITKNMKESEDLDDLFIDGIISDIVEATAADYAKLSDSELKDLLDIFSNVGRSSAKPIVNTIKKEIKRRSIKDDVNESTELEEADNRLVAHSPAAAARLIKKLKNKFSGYKWDSMVKGDEIIYPNEPHIIRFIKKQPEVANMKEEVELEEAKGVSTWYPKEFYNKNKNKYLVHFTAGREDSKVFDRSRSGLNSAYKYMEKQKDYAVLIFIDKSGKPEVLERGSKTQVAESTELEEAKAPFASLEKDWLRAKGIDTPRAQKTRDRLIKKYNLRPLISNVRPGAIKLGPLNDLKAKTGNHTIAGLDTDGELIFVSNNPVRIHYPSHSKKRPEGEELITDSVSLETLRLRKVVEVSLGESIEDIDTFISEASIDMTMTPSAIQKAHKKYVIERKGVPTYEIYHKSYSDAVQSAKSYAKGSGYEVDEDDWHDQISTGPRKPSKDKMNRFSIMLNKNGKPQKKRLQIQVTNIGTSGRPFELNAYIA